MNIEPETLTRLGLLVLPLFVIWVLVTSVMLPGKRLIWVALILACLLFWGGLYRALEALLT